VAETITIIDDRTGKKVTVPIRDGVFPSTALRELDPDLRMYDPAFLSTAACASSITYIDGEAGILRYRGYPIEQLAEKSTYLEVAYLLLNGELPNAEQLKNWNYEVTHHTMIHENMRKRFVDGFTTTHTQWACSFRLSPHSALSIQSRKIFSLLARSTNKCCD